ncbi:DoxX family protein [uncultured Aquimarina sp.]|uniref:DoxX family protein n=1 Tax=uncultured Aquimarina sp. TaxID=575652 RepID=UPI002619D047|nr:DoxX family protein [uncultured Aquimarina sp.]
MKTKLNTLLSSNITKSKVDIALLVFRVCLALSLFNTHGLKKVFHFSETLEHIPDPLGIGGTLSTYFAIFANVVCPLFVMLGLLTRIAILPIISITLLGFFIVHISDPWVVKDVPLMYSLSFLVLLYLGPGSHSLDYKFFKK